MISAEVKHAAKQGWRRAQTTHGYPSCIEYLRTMPDGAELQVVYNDDGFWEWEIWKLVWNSKTNQMDTKRQTAGFQGPEEKYSTAMQAAMNEWKRKNFSDFDNYQKVASITRTDSLHMPLPVYLSLGLAGETGEAVEKIKKLYRDKGGVLGDEDRDALRKELGDILWYLGQLAAVCGISLTDIVGVNIEKFLDRLERDKVHGEGDNR